MLREPEIIVRRKINQRPAGTTDAGSADLVDRLQSPIQRSLFQIRDDLFVRIGFQWVRCEIAAKARKERRKNTANGRECTRRKISRKESNGEQADSQKITTDWPEDLSPITFHRLPFAPLRLCVSFCLPLLLRSLRSFAAIDSFLRCNRGLL